MKNCRAKSRLITNKPTSYPPTPYQCRQLSGSPCLASRGGRTEADNQSRATTIYHVQRRSLGTADVSIPTPPSCPTPAAPCISPTFFSSFHLLVPPPPPAACRVVCIVMSRHLPLCLVVTKLVPLLYSSGSGSKKKNAYL